MKRYTLTLVVDVEDTGYGPEGTLDMLFEHGMDFFEADWSISGEIQVEDMEDED